MPKSEFSDKEIIKLTNERTKSSQKVKADSILYSQAAKTDTDVEETKVRRVKKISSKQIAAEKAAKEREFKERTAKSGHTLALKRPTAKAGSTQVTKTTQKPKMTYADRMHQREKLEHYREQLEVLVEEANARVERLANSRKFESRALDAAVASRPESRNPSDNLFTADLRTEKQIKRELSRVMTFLNDPTSLATGAERFTNDFTAAGLFGGQYRAKNGHGYDTSVVDEEVGETVLDIYHRALEEAGGWERVMGYFRANSGGLIEYGSSNLINAIYDMVVQLGTGYSAQERIRKRAVKMMNAMLESYQDMAKRQRAGVDYGIIGYDETAADRRSHWEWQMFKKGLM